MINNRLFHERLKQSLLANKDTGRYDELKIQLVPEKLMAQARDETGLNDFGDEAFLEPYYKLLDCVARDVDFTEEGLQGFKFQVHRCLINRLRMFDDLKKHPEILSEDVSDPIVVIGLPRTGTTKIQRMLSALKESDIQKTYLWQMMNPAPFPDAVAGKPDPRVTAASPGSIVSEDRPDLNAAHSATANEPEEDGIMGAATFDDWIWSSVFAPSVSYYEWVINRPHAENYKYLHTLYQYLQWQNGGRKNRRWISKNVQHIAYISELFQYFPKATVIHCHRSPYESIPSLAKLTESMWGGIVQTVDPAFTGKAMLHWWGSAMDTYLETRDKLPPEHNIMDVSYTDIKTNALDIITTAYDKAGIALNNTQIDRISSWEANNKQHKHGKHIYSLSEFGLTTDDIDGIFGDYINRFIKH